MALLINPEMQLAYISHRNMTQEHIDAVGMVTEFFNCFAKVFPERSLPHKIPNVNKDPRSTYVFRCCLCAVQQINPEKLNYHEWVLAQLKVLKAVKSEIIITAQCLCGERAKKRWFVWLKYKNQQVHHHAPAPPKEVFDHILEEMKQTHKFLNLKRKSVKQLTEDGSIKWLLDVGKVSPHYVLLHPDIQEVVKTKGMTALNQKLEKIKITPELQLLFKEAIKQV
jgi:hypothetical protein